MNIKKCTSSHFYDSDKHSVCPHCFPEISCFSDGGNTEENIPDSAECVQQASDDKTCSFREKNTEKAPPAADNFNNDINQAFFTNENDGHAENKINADENGGETFSAAPLPHSNDVYCSSCGALNKKEYLYCASCGGPMKKIDLEKQNWQNNAQYVQNKKAVSLKEFIEKYADPAIKKEIRSTAIIAYVCAGITFAVSLLFNWLGIIDALLFAGFALGMHLKKSRVCAVLMLVLGCVEVIVSLAAGRTTPPVLWLIAGIGAVAVFRKAGKQYKNFVLGSMQGSCEK